MKRCHVSETDIKESSERKKSGGRYQMLPEENLSFAPPLESWGRFSQISGNPESVQFPVLASLQCWFPRIEQVTVYKCRRGEQLWGLAVQMGGLAGQRRSRISAPMKWQAGQESRPLPAQASCLYTEGLDGKLPFEVLFHRSSHGTVCLVH